MQGKWVNNWDLAIRLLNGTCLLLTGHSRLIPICNAFFIQGERQWGHIIKRALCIGINRLCERVEITPVKCKWNKVLSQRRHWLKSKQQERLRRRNTLGCLDQYAAQNSDHARPPIPSQPPTQKVFSQWHTQYDPPWNIHTVKQSM